MTMHRDDGIELDPSTTSHSSPTSSSTSSPAKPSPTQPSISTLDTVISPHISSTTLSSTNSSTGLSSTQTTFPGANTDRSDQTSQTISESFDANSGSQTPSGTTTSSGLTMAPDVPIQSFIPISAQGNDDNEHTASNRRTVIVACVVSVAVALAALAVALRRFVTRRKARRGVTGDDVVVAPYITEGHSDAHPGAATPRLLPERGANVSTGAATPDMLSRGLTKSTMESPWPVSYYESPPSYSD